MPGIPPKNLFYVIMLDDDLSNIPDRYLFRKCEANKDTVVNTTHIGVDLINVPRSDFNNYSVLPIKSRIYTHSVTGSQHQGKVYEFKK